MINIYIQWAICCFLLLFNLLNIYILWVIVYKPRNGPFAASGGPKIVPVDKAFDWKTTIPRKFRPFKPKFNLTMGISRPSPQDWLLLENTYSDRIDHHNAIFESKHRDETALCNPIAADGVYELYDMAIKFLVARYPKQFSYTVSDLSLIRFFSFLNSSMLLFKNKITGDVYPASSKLAREWGMSPRDLLWILGKNIEEDFLLMVYDPEIKEYRLQACTGIAANGFLWKTRLGFKLTDLHGPIPEYQEKLQFSMNRFFSKMEPNEPVQRFTYKVQLSAHDQIFLPQGNNQPNANTDFGRDVYMRLERQQLFRLPESRCILFTIRTYMYPIQDIREEGLGAEMAASIRSWPEDFAKYKHREEWGEPTLAYLDAK